MAKRVLYRKKKRVAKRKKTVYLKHKSVSRSQITKVSVKVGGPGTAAPAAAPVIVSGASGGGGGDMSYLLPYLMQLQPPAPAASSPPVTEMSPPMPPPPLRDMDADTFAVPNYPQSRDVGIQSTPFTADGGAQTATSSADISSQTNATSSGERASQTDRPSLNAAGTQATPRVVAAASQTRGRRMTHTGAQTRPMTLNDGSTAPMLALEAPMQVDDALPHVSPDVASALRDAVAPIQRMVADLQRGFGDASTVTRMIAQQQIAFGNSIIGENREAKREVRSLFDTLRGELPRHAPPSGVPAGPMNAGPPGQLVVYQDERMDDDEHPARPPPVNFDDAAAAFARAAAAVPPPPPAPRPAEVAAAAAAAMEAMRAAAPAAPAAAPLPDFNATAAMGPEPDAVPFVAPPKARSKRVLSKLFHHLYHQGRTHGDATLIAAANSATDALKGDSPDLMALTIESLRLIKQAKQLEVARQAFGLQERETAAAEKAKRKPIKTYIVSGTKTRAKARAESERTKRAAKRDDNRNKT
ncbi:hypothetical protein JKP88DRAFT_276842 [Tribonema minus]|uniref:Uncharacterized protein n=1 Tax=Tribonema minus TaxID=303371 RepID=A0A835Z9R0_9STRA|nr:hypothetical protein JKP88DRAFT_276842 [Tribonema minus]